MNFALIPFFLAGNIVVDQPDEWIHGPEYIFYANSSYTVSTDLLEEPFLASAWPVLIKCRPRSADTLLCRFQDPATDGQNEDAQVEILELTRPFLIKFDQRGIESLMFTNLINTVQLNFIRNIIKELSIGMDLKANANALPTFVAMENYVLGECATLFTVSKYDKNEGLFQDHEQKRNYNLKVSSLPDDGSDLITVVEKRTDHKRCFRMENQFYKTQNTDIKIRKSISKMQISSDTFKSQTDMQIKLLKKTKKQDLIALHTVTLELLSIEPAKEELPSMEFNVVTNLGFNTNNERNIL